jgi:hypothetical protein
MLNELVGDDRLKRSKSPFYRAEHSLVLRCLSIASLPCAQCSDAPRVQFVSEY